MAALFIIVALSPKRLVYDEQWHMEGARLLANGAGLHDLLTADLPSAPGPLYPVLEATFAPLTDLAAPEVRWLNLVIFIGLLYVVSFCLSRFGFAHSLIRAGSIMAAPTIWLISGMALTEIPAMLMAGVSMAFVICGIQVALPEEGAWRDAVSDRKRTLFLYSCFAAAGIFAGLAVLGRQTYLPALAAFIVIAVLVRQARYPSLLGLLIAIATVAPVFLVWKGLTPPSQSHVGGFSVTHGLLAFAYLSVSVALLAPRFFQARWRVTAAITSLSFLFNFALIRFSLNAFGTISDKVIPIGLHHLYELLAGSALVAAFTAFVVATVVNSWNHRRDVVFLSMGALTLLLTATTFGIVHLFSSRYATIGFPFALVWVQPFNLPSRWTAARLLLGGVLGAASLIMTYA